MSKDIFSAFQYQGELDKKVTLLTSKTGAGDVYLMSVGTGCLSIRQEFRENWK